MSVFTDKRAFPVLVEDGENTALARQYKNQAATSASDSAASAVDSGRYIPYDGWASGSRRLSAATGMAVGQQVIITGAAADATITDPVSGATVLENGKWEYVDTPSTGWTRVDDLDSQTAAEFALTDDEKATVRRARRMQSLYRDKFLGWIAPFFNNAGQVLAGIRDTGDFYSFSGFTSRVESVKLRDGPFGTPLAVDNAGKRALAIKPDGSVYARKFSLDTIRRLFSLAQSAGYYSPGSTVANGMVAGVPGWNHRPFDDNNYLITMPTAFGPVDVLYPKDGSGIQFAITRLPVELLSMSAQSNALDGGTPASAADTYNTVVRELYDPHRAYRWSGGRGFGDGVGSASPYVDGVLTAVTPAGQPYEIAGINQWTPDNIQFSCIATDQRKQRAQRPYLQMVTAEGGTPLVEYMAGTTKGDNIAGFIPGSEVMMAGAYSRELIMYAHFLIGHEDDTHTGYASYGALLSAFADEVCGYGAALSANVDAGLRPKVITYQPNVAINTFAADRKSMKQGVIDTLHTALSDSDVVCIGPVYHELTVDDGIHMAGKLMTGELFSYVYDIIRAGNTFTPLHVTSAVRSGTTITLTIDGPLGLVQKDDDWLPDLSAVDFGLFFDDDTSSAAISSVTVVNTDYDTRVIEVELDGVPSGANPKIYIGGQNNGSDGGHPGGMTAFYVPGPKSFWHSQGYTAWTTPEIRFYLCRDIVDVTT